MIAYSSVLTTSCGNWDVYPDSEWLRFEMKSEGHAQTSSLDHGVSSQPSKTKEKWNAASSQHLCTRATTGLRVMNSIKCIFLFYDITPKSKRGNNDPTFSHHHAWKPCPKGGFWQKCSSEWVDAFGESREQTFIAFQKATERNMTTPPEKCPKMKKQTPFCQVSNFERCKKDQEGNFSHPFFIQNAWIIHLFQTLHSVSSNQALKHDSPCKNRTFPFPC